MNLLFVQNAHAKKNSSYNKGIKLRVNEILHFKNYDLLICMKGYNMYRLVVDKDLYASNRIRIGKYTTFNVQPLEFGSFTLLQEYYCKCENVRGKFYGAGYYIINDKSIVLPDFMNTNNTYFGILLK